ncbi:MAG: NAD-dependent protein deacylase [Rhodospirillales bacterium]
MPTSAVPPSPASTAWPPRRIVILTGAGISKESGLDTFRDRDGLWSRVRIEDVATPEAFARDPERVQAFYNARRDGLLDAAIQPNAAHRALASFQADYPGQVLLVTQNIDDLHERAGADPLIHMHGALLEAACLACGDTSPWRQAIAAESACPACGRPGRLRPNVVWFGEMPFEMERIGEALAACDLFVSIGTSGKVYPAAGFVAEAKAAGAHCVELNLEPSEVAPDFAEHHHGPASQVVPDYLQSLLDRAARDPA